VRVCVLFNQPVLAREHPEADSERWVATAVEDVTRLLTATGFHVNQLGVGRNPVGLKRQLVAGRPDVVFNLFEGLADRPETEITVVRWLERLQVPFTGSPSEALRLALNKHLTKRRLRAAGLPTPWSCVTSKLLPEGTDFRWPVIVKPARRDASEGIDQSSIATATAALARRVAAVLEQYGPPVLIEQFIPGREFTVALVEAPDLVPLPIAEVQFATSSAVPWPILTYAAKWQPGTPDYEATVMQNAAPLPPALSRLLSELAIKAFRAVGCRDYARIDLRLTLAGEPMILEVNPNPDMSPSACFAGAISAAGLDRAELMAHFVRQAATRPGDGTYMN
jgi:D-alanine-D-alanine ligase